MGENCIDFSFRSDDWTAKGFIKYVVRKEGDTLVLDFDLGRPDIEKHDWELFSKLTSPNERINAINSLSYYSTAFLDGAFWGIKYAYQQHLNAQKTTNLGLYIRIVEISGFHATSQELIAYLSSKIVEDALGIPREYQAHFDFRNKMFCFPGAVEPWPVGRVSVNEVKKVYADFEDQEQNEIIKDLLTDAQKAFEICNPSS